MPHLIDYQDWEPLHLHAEKNLANADSLARYFKITPKKVPPQTLNDYLDEFGELTRVINDTRKKSPELRLFLDHDFGNSLNPLIRAYALLRIQDYNKGFPALQENFYINRSIKNIIESVRFYVDEKLEAEEISLTDFFIRERKTLERAFYDEIPQGKKLKFIIREELKAQVHEGTLATLLQNICSNAYKRGGAQSLFIYVFRQNKYIKILMKDDGVGIFPLINEANDQGPIDHIFIRGVSHDGSTGLGLGDAKERMQLMGGDIICRGHEGLTHLTTGTKGASFEIILVESLKNS